MDKARIFLRPLGTPLALGLFAVTVQTTMLAALQLEWITPTQGTVVAITGLAFAAPVQLVTAVLAFLARDGVAGTALGIFAGTWTVSSLATLTSPPGVRSEALAIYFILAAILLTCVLAAGAAAAGKLILVVVLGFGSSRLLVTGLYELHGGAGLETAAGVLGLALGAVALYAGLAFLLEDARNRVVLPTLRPDGVKQSVHDEAGVRPQL